VNWAADGGFWRKRRRHGDSEARNANEEGLPLLASAGADGVVKVWRHSTEKVGKKCWDCVATIDHGSLRKELMHQPLISGLTGAETLRNMESEVKMESGEHENYENKDPPQVYALQFISGWGECQNKSSTEEANCDGFTKHTGVIDVLLTSSDDFLHLWCSDNCEESMDSDKSGRSEPLLLKRYLTIRFGHLSEGHGGVFVHSSMGYNSRNCHGEIIGQIARKDDASDNAMDRPFGGVERNPNNLVYVFDACYCPSRSLLGVALSDGTLRLIDSVGVCLSVMELREWRTHITSLAWDNKGRRLVCTTASGHVILWDVGDKSEEGTTRTRYRALLEGGHDTGRPVFGGAFCGGLHSQELLLSWGVDGKVCLWDAWSEGHVHSPLAILVDKGPDFPVYTVDVHEPNSGSRPELDTEESKSTLSVGGGREGGFLGIPVFLYDVISNQATKQHSSG